MVRIVAVMGMLLIGCASIHQSEFATEAPELIKMAPLPSTSSPLPMGGLKLYVLLHVLADGTVGEARMIESSGFTEWDTLAIQSIMQWRFSPGRRNGVPVDLWIRQPIVVQPQEPTFYVLGEIVVTRRETADSLYALLTGGADFDSLARQASLAPSRGHGGYLGRVDVAVYPLHVREDLRRLSDDGITPPVRVGETYIIYKKFKKE